MSMCVLLAILFSTNLVTAAPAVISLFDQFINDLASQNCTFPSKAPFALDDFKSSLQVCKGHETLDSGEEHYLCEEVFRNLKNLSCSLSSEAEIQAVVGVPVSSDVCRDIKTSAITPPPNEENFLKSLKQTAFTCKMLCMGHIESACKVLLWSYEALDAVEKLKTPKSDHDENKNLNVESLPKIKSVTDQTAPNTENEGDNTGAKVEEIGEVQHSNKLPYSDVVDEEKPNFASDEKAEAEANALNKDIVTSVTEPKLDQDLQKLADRDDGALEDKSEAEMDKNTLKIEGEIQKNADEKSPEPIFGDVVPDLDNQDERINEIPDKEKTAEKVPNPDNANSENVKNVIYDLNTVSKGATSTTKITHNTFSTLSDPTGDKSGTSFKSPNKNSVETASKTSDINSPHDSDEKPPTSKEINPSHASAEKVDGNPPKSVPDEPKKVTEAPKSSSDAKKPDVMAKVQVVKAVDDPAKIKPKETITSSEEFKPIPTHPDLEEMDIDKQSHKDQEYNEFNGDDEYPKNDYDPVEIPEIRTQKPKPAEKPFPISSNEIPKRYQYQSRESSDGLPVIAGFPEEEDSHFFFYLLSFVLIVMIGYIVFHNKQKIIALIVEGRSERRPRGHGARYKKLDTK